MPRRCFLAGHHRIVGRALYALCTIRFTASAEDVVDRSASVIFLVAGVIFLIPVLRSQDEENSR